MREERKREIKIEKDMKTKEMKMKSRKKWEESEKGGECLKV